MITKTFTHRSRLLASAVQFNPDIKPWPMGVAEGIIQYCVMNGPASSELLPRFTHNINGFYYYDGRNAKLIQPTDYIVSDSNNNHHIMSAKEFNEQFEPLSTLNTKAPPIAE